MNLPDVRRLQALAAVDHGLLPIDHPVPLAHKLLKPRLGLVLRPGLLRVPVARIHGYALGVDPVVLLVGEASGVQ